MNHGNHRITAVSLSHATTSVSALEPLVTTDDSDTLTTLCTQDGVHEAFVLQTCSRAEAYIVTDTEDTAKSALDAYLSPVTNTGSVTWFTHDDAIKHLMRVACGLESIVVGEDQILGQVKSAYQTAIEADTLGPMLEPAVLKAMHVGKHARTTTSINDGIVSLSSAAACVARDHYDLNEVTVLIVGAGEIALGAARHIATGADRLYIANRSRGNAEYVASTLPEDTPVTVHTLNDLPALLKDADIVITATGSSKPVITADAVPDIPVKAGSDNDSLTIIDIAQPSDVDPGLREHPEITVIGLDDLAELTAETRAERREAIRSVESLVEKAFTELVTQYKRHQADVVIAGMYQGAERIKQEELQRAIRRLETAGDLSNEQREIVTSLVDALVNQLLAAPTESLRDAAEHEDWETIRTAIQLFDPTTISSNDIETPVPPALDVPIESPQNDSATDTATISED